MEDRRRVAHPAASASSPACAEFRSQPGAVRHRAGSAAGDRRGGQGIKHIQDSTYTVRTCGPATDAQRASPEKFNAAAKALRLDAIHALNPVAELNALPEIYGFACFTRTGAWTDELITRSPNVRRCGAMWTMPLHPHHGTCWNRMRRETSQHTSLDLVAKIRAGVPGSPCVRTFIVGFPGEKDAYFQTLLDLFATRSSRMGGVYLLAGGRHARRAMEGQLPDKFSSGQRPRPGMRRANEGGPPGWRSRSWGVELKVLIEGEARAKELQKGQISSWEQA